jgi:hypothetical protein
MKGKTPSNLTICLSAQGTTPTLTQMNNSFTMTKFLAVIIEIEKASTNVSMEPSFMLTILSKYPLSHNNSLKYNFY